MKISFHLFVLKFSFNFRRNWQTTVIGFVLLISTHKNWINASPCQIDNLQNYTESLKNCAHPISELVFNVKTWDSAAIPQALIDQTTTIKTIDVSNKSLASIHDKGLCRWPNLAYIIADQNNLTTLMEKVFGECHALKHLTLSKCNISEVYDNAFGGLVLLIDLNLANNQIGQLSADVFHPLKLLEKLSLNNNKIQAIDVEHFAKNTKLKLLDLSSNSLNVLDSASFVKLKALETLDLSINPDLSSVYFDQMDKLQDVIVSNASLLNLRIPQNVNKIDAQFNKIATLKIDPNTTLKELNIASNFLQSIDGLSVAEQLTMLDASNNNITRIDFTQFVGMSLNHINVLGNPIQIINMSSLANLTSLRTLGISTIGFNSTYLTDFINELKRLNISLHDPYRNEKNHTIFDIPQVTPVSKSATSVTSSTVTTIKPDTTSITSITSSSRPSDQGSVTPTTSKPIASSATPDTKDAEIQKLLDRISKLEQNHSTDDHDEIKESVSNLRITIVCTIVAFSLFVSFQIAVFIATNYKRWPVPVLHFFSNNNGILNNGGRNGFGSIDPIMEEVL